jgi:hypothetical protein
MYINKLQIELYDKIQDSLEVPVSLQDWRSSAIFLHDILQKAQDIIEKFLVHRDSG